MTSSGLMIHGWVKPCDSFATSGGARWRGRSANRIYRRGVILAVSIAARSAGRWPMLSWWI